jgi:hypothetical protein
LGVRRNAGLPPRGARPKLQAAKRAGAAAIGDVAASEGLVPDRDANTPKPSGPPDPDLRRGGCLMATPSLVGSAGLGIASARRLLGVAGYGGGSGVF